MSLQHLTSLKNSSLIVEVGMPSGGAAQAADQRKHIDIGKNCRELDWNNIPLAVELYGAWGQEARWHHTLCGNTA